MEPIEGYIEVRRNRFTRRWRVVTVGANNEDLSVSETLNSRAAVETNIEAQTRAWAFAPHVVWPEGI